MSSSSLAPPCDGGAAAATTSFGIPAGSCPRIRTYRKGYKMQTAATEGNDTQGAGLQKKPQSSSPYICIYLYYIYRYAHDRYVTWPFFVRVCLGETTADGTISLSFIIIEPSCVVLKLSFPTGDIIIGYGCEMGTISQTVHKFSRV